MKTITIIALLLAFALASTLGCSSRNAKAFRVTKTDATTTETVKETVLPTCTITAVGRHSRVVAESPGGEPCPVVGQVLVRCDVGYLAPTQADCSTYHGFRIKSEEQQ